MLSVRLPETIERDLAKFCRVRNLTKSQVVQEALAEYLVAARVHAPCQPLPEPDLSYLAPDDPFRAFIGIAKDGMSTDELMRLTRGGDWKQP